MQQTIHFWNGNKAPIRQQYELDLLRISLAAQMPAEDIINILDDLTNYPLASDEGLVFEKGADVCVTVAGNTKFANSHFLPINIPLMYGLVGHRLLIIRKNDADKFKQIKTKEMLASLTAGVPDTWADAQLMRDNQLPVNETGDLLTIFDTLSTNQCDYIALGLNEIDSIFNSIKHDYPSLQIEQNLRIYYPMSLIFYVNPNRQDLADTLTKGVHKIAESGQMLALFNRYFEHVLCSNWTARLTLEIKNDKLPLLLSDAMYRCKKELESNYPSTGMSGS